MARTARTLAIAKNVLVDIMTAEMFGKLTGLGRGKGGYIRLFDPDNKFSGIVGAALAAKNVAPILSRFPSSARAPPTRALSTKR